MLRDGRTSSCVQEATGHDATTEVDSGGVPVGGATEVNCPTCHLHESPAAEVDSGVDSRGSLWRGRAVRVAALVAWWKTQTPPRRARHESDRADARPILLSREGKRELEGSES